VIAINVLVLDDSNFARGLIIQELKALGLEEQEIHQAAGGSEALEKLASQAYDLYILDIIMPGVGGVEVLKAIHNIQKQAKVIMCSSSYSPELVRSLLAIGIDAFVVKPVNSLDFRRKFVRITGRLPSEEFDQGWTARCHVCGKEMLEVANTGIVTFFCPGQCMEIGPLMSALVSQEQLDKDYQAAREKSRG
jgi:CheY-like chemotaxis protein